jgi:hypothetical protein
MKVLQALWMIDPWDDERADLRARSSTLNIMAALTDVSKVSDDEFMRYLRIQREHPKTMEESIEGVRSILGGGH